MADMRITDGKGVQFEFDNGITISIQIGRGNYSDNYDFPSGKITYENPLPSSSTAELAVWDEDRSWFRLDDYLVAAYVPMNKVLDFVAYLGALPAGTKASDFTLDTSTIATA